MQSCSGQNVVIFKRSMLVVSTNEGNSLQTVVLGGINWRFILGSNLPVKYLPDGKCEILGCASGEIEI